MKLKIAVCDDEAVQREYLLGLIHPWAERNRHLIEVKQYSGAKQFLFDYEEEKDFDILLLDIEMPEINGIDIAKAVRQQCSTVQIIFVTGFYEYFSDGFDVSALHYLIKPMNADKLCPVLDKAVGNLSYRQRSVLIATPEEEIKLSLADIIYIHADNVYINVCAVNGQYRTRVSLAKFSEQLDDTFLKVHRSYVVGLKFIRKITKKEITMMNGDIVPISRGMYAQVHEALIKYL